jgi:hypothetical protein
LIKQQKSMRENFRRPLLNWKAFALVVLGFALYPALTLFRFPLFRREAHVGKIAFYDSQQRELFCNDTWLFLRRTEISHGIVQTLELHRLGSCGDVRLPARKGEGYVNYASRDPSFVLREQFPAYRGTTSQKMLTGKIAEATLDHELRPRPLE